jgi:hypothetical protein
VVLQVNSALLFDLAWLFKVEAVRENNRSSGDGGESMRLFCISIELEDKARNKRREEVEAAYMGDIE